MILVKIGGGKEIRWDYISEDIASLMSHGEKICVVHGASEKRDEIAKQLGMPSKIITSPSGVQSVFTDEKAIDIFLMVYAGLVNKKIVATLQRYCVNAVGLSGIDGRLWTAEKKDVVYAVENSKTKIIHNNLTGRVTSVNTKLIHLLINENYTPVICPPAITADNVIVNTDNDFATTVMIGNLGIKTMVSLFQANGLLKDTQDEQSIIKVIEKDHILEHLKYAKGRMKKKLLGAHKAFEMGLETMYWGDGRVRNPIIKAMRGEGTIIQSL